MAVAHGSAPHVVPETSSRASVPAIRQPPYNALTSLRFFAAAAIVLHHTDVNLPALQKLNAHLALYQGVAFFFVLSGFILSHVYSRLDDDQCIKRFLVARVARIWPLHIAALALAIAVLAPAVGKAQHLPLLANVLMFHAWVPNYNYTLHFNPPSWSISTEFFFYLCFPFLLRALNRSPRRLAIGASALLIAVLSFCSLNFHSNITQDIEWALLYQHPLSRIFEFIAGMLLYKALSAPRTREAVDRFSTPLWMVSLAVLAVTLQFESFLPCTTGTVAFPWLSWLKSTGGVVPYLLIVAAATARTNWITRLLSNPIAVRLGEISYAMYLIHFTVFRLHGDHVWKYIPGGAVTGYISYWIMLLILSDRIYAWFEVPARDWINKRFAQRRPASVSAVQPI